MGLKLRRKIWTGAIGISVANKKGEVQTTVAEICQGEYKEKVCRGKLGKG